MKIRDGFVLALALGLGLTGCASSGGGGTTTTVPSDGGNILAQGERPRDTENTRAAEGHIGAAEEAASPEEARPHYQQAMQSAQAAVTEDPTNPLAHRLAAFAALGLEDYVAAGQHFDRAEELRPIYEIELAPVREQAYIDLYQAASPHLQSGAYTEAAGILESANAVYPERPEALITLAQIYAQERNHDLAIERIDEAIAFFSSERLSEVDPETAVAWQEQADGLPLMRAQVLADAGRYEEAVGTYRELAAADPTNIAVTQDLAAILMQMGNEAEALEVYEALLARPSLSPQDYYRIGVGFYQASDYERAAQAFGEAAQRSRMDRDAIEMWARSLQLDSAYAAVPPVAERWIELDPASQIAITVLAQAVNATGDAARAGEVIRRVDALPMTVNDLQMRRFAEGGAQVTGAVSNLTLQQGSSVTLEFTFYGTSGERLGTARQQVPIRAPGMSEVFQVEFSSDQPVGGYGYTYATP
jgi:tetratricopeptide (TPR) repeat protein